MQRRIPRSLVLGLTLATLLSMGPRPAQAAHLSARPAISRTATLSQAQYTSTQALRWAAQRWHISYWWLYDVAWCESRLLPWAYNPSGASGLMQFEPATYWAYAPRIGERRSYWNPWAAANVAAFLFSRGLSYLWSCA